MKFFYYLMYLTRRLLRIQEPEKGSADWRSTIVLLVAEVRLAMALVYVLAPALLQRGNPVILAIAIGVPLALVTHLLLEDQKKYARFASEFKNWPPRKRLVADVASVLFLVAAVVSPLVARWFVTGKSLLD